MNCDAFNDKRGHGKHAQSQQTNRTQKVIHRHTETNTHPISVTLSFSLFLDLCLGLSPSPSHTHTRTVVAGARVVKVSAVVKPAWVRAEHDVVGVALSSVGAGHVPHTVFSVVVVVGRHVRHGLARGASVVEILVKVVDAHGRSSRRQHGEQQRCHKHHPPHHHHPHHRRLVCGEGEKEAGGCVSCSCCCCCCCCCGGGVKGEEEERRRARGDRGLRRGLKKMFPLSLNRRGESKAGREGGGASDGEEQQREKRERNNAQQQPQESKLPKH